MKGSFFWGFPEAARVFISSTYKFIVNSAYLVYEVPYVILH